MGPRAHAARLPPDRRRQRVVGRLGGHRRGAWARGSCASRVPGFGAACFAGLMAAARRPRVLHGLRRVAGSRATCGACRPRRRRDADLVLGARQGAAPGRARAVANAVVARRAAPPHRRRAARPRTDAGRPPRGAARPRHRRPALRLAAGDGPARGGGGLARRRGRRRATARARGARRSPAPSAGPCAPSAT